MGTKTQKLSNVVDQIVEWQAVFTGDGSTGLTAVAGRGYFIDTTSGTVTVTTPASPKQGDKITIVDYAGTFATNNVTINFNGAKVFGASNTGTLATNFQVIDLIYIDSTQGWRSVNQDTTSDIQTATYIGATGGTITTSGDYKIHTFTGDGCFVVSSAGNPIGSETVDYLIVAGGGGGGGQYIGGGGGAGGYRESSGAASGCYTVSPLGACVAALPVSATTYPVTVGGGGSGGSAANATDATSGSNSIFSSITSAGGGYGKQDQANPANPGTGGPGGSGGGGAGSATFTGPGTGNTPPVSPPQGNNGGTGASSGPASLYAGGGGGGATAVGVDGSLSGSGAGGNGGAGATSSINGTPTARAGGGGGNNYNGGTQGTGGTGGGGAANQNSPGVAGTANTGGGGGGTDSRPGPNSGGAGGSGIVIKRYKFQ